MSNHENEQQSTAAPRSAPQPVSLLVLAGGMGSRFGGDKQLATIGTTERTLLHFSVLDAYRAGVRHLVLLVRESLIPAFKTTVLPHFPRDLSVEFVIQQLDDLPESFIVPAGRVKPWGTAHAVWAARQQLTQPFIVINADDYYGPNAMKLLVDHFQHGDDWAMVAYPVTATLSQYGGVNRGCCEVMDQQLHAVFEWTDIRDVQGQLIGKDPHGIPKTVLPTQLVSMNIWGFTPALMPKLEQALRAFLQQNPEARGECYLPSVVDQSLATQRLHVYASNEQWYGMTYADDLAQLTSVFEQKLPAYQE